MALLLALYDQARYPGCRARRAAEASFLSEVWETDLSKSPIR